MRLAKIDIEGAEWEVLADPRFVACAPPLLVLEYHPVPGVVDAAAEARALLQAAGYELAEGATQAFGIGMLWARRQDWPTGAQEEQHRERLRDEVVRRPSHTAIHVCSFIAEVAVSGEHKCGRRSSALRRPDEFRIEVARLGWGPNE